MWTLIAIGLYLLFLILVIAFLRGARGPEEKFDNETSKQHYEKTIF